MARINTEQAAALLGVSYRTVLSYQRDFKPGGREPHFPEVDGYGNRGSDEVKRWARERLAARIHSGRVDTEGAARILGITKASIYHRGAFANGSTFPERAEDGTFSVAELLDWDRRRAGTGGAGQPKPKSTYPCEVCETLVKRRKRDEVDGLLKCGPCYVAGDPMLSQSTG